MDPKEIQAILEKAIAAATKQPEKADNKVEENISNLAKAVQAIVGKIDNLEKVAVRKEVETPETAVQKIATTVADLVKKIDEMKNPVKDEDKPMDFSKMTKKEFSELLKGMLKPEVKNTPAGKGKDSINDVIEKSVNDEDEVEVDVSEIESHDVAGNELTDKQRLARKQLDEFLGAKLGNFSKKYGEDTSEDSEDSEDDGK
jgi:hypothetical protein